MGRQECPPHRREAGGVGIPACPVPQPIGKIDRPDGPADGPGLIGGVQAYSCRVDDRGDPPRSSRRLDFPLRGASPRPPGDEHARRQHLGRPDDPRPGPGRHDHHGEDRRRRRASGRGTFAAGPASVRAEPGRDRGGGRLPVALGPDLRDRDRLPVRPLSGRAGRRRHPDPRLEGADLSRRLPADLHGHERGDPLLHRRLARRIRASDLDRRRGPGGGSSSGATTSPP